MHPPAPWSRLSSNGNRTLAAPHRQASRAAASRSGSALRSNLWVWTLPAPVGCVRRRCDVLLRAGYLVHRAVRDHVVSPPVPRRAGVCAARYVSGRAAMGSAEPCPSAEGEWRVGCKAEVQRRCSGGRGAPARRGRTEGGPGRSNHCMPSRVSAAGPSRLCSRRSGAGAHQFHSPSSVMVAGTSRQRTRVASMATATASATPVCLITSSSPATNPENTSTTISAAEVMIRPDRCSPATTASLFAHALVPELLDPAEQEHLVVHGQPEPKGDHQDRDDRLDAAGGLEARAAIRRGRPGTPRPARPARRRATPR